MTIKIFVSHMNREDELTRIAHEFCDYLDSDSRFSTWRDTEHFGSRQITQTSVIEQLIRSGINKSQIFVILFFPDYELSRDISDWLIEEERKAINASMPVLEIYLHGAKQRYIFNQNELNYRKRYTLYFENYEKWMESAKGKLFEIAHQYNLG